MILRRSDLRAPRPPGASAIPSFRTDAPTRSQLLSAIEDFFSHGLPAHLISQLTGPKGDKGDSGLSGIQGPSGFSIGSVYPTATNQSAGTIGGITFFGAKELTSQTLTVSGNSTLSTLTVSGGASIGGSLTAGTTTLGDTTLSSLTVSGSSVWSAASISSNLELTSGYASLSNTLWVSPPGYAGNVGVGTRSPAQKLDVAGSIGGNSLTAQNTTALTLAGGSGSSGAGQITLGNGSNGQITITPGDTLSSAFEYVDIRPSTNNNALGADSFGMRTLFIMNASSIAYHSAGILGQLVVSSTNAVNATQYLAGLYGYVRHDGTGTLSETNGVLGVIMTNGLGNITEANAFRSELGQTSGTGRIVTARNFYAPAFTNAAGAAKPTTLVGFDSADQGIDGGLATNVYAFRSLGNTKSLFSGPVILGSSLSMFGPLTSTGNTQSTSTSTGDIITAGGLGIAKNLWVGQTLNFPATGSTCTTGIVFGTSNECMFRVSAGVLKITAGGALILDADLRPNTTGAYDLGSSSLKWRQIFVSGTSTLGSVNISGDTGIGATTPEQKLEVAGNILASASAASVGLILNNLSEDDAKFTIQSTGTSGSVARLDFLGSASQAFMSIASSGNLGINTTTPVQKLQVAGDIRVGTGTTGCVEDADGTVISGTCSSDERFKKDIVPLPSILDRLSRLQPSFYRWRSDEFPDRHWGTEVQVGLIAQQVAPSMPELIATASDGFLQVRYNDLPLYLLSGIQELASRAFQLDELLAPRSSQLEPSSGPLARLVRNILAYIADIFGVTIEQDTVQSKNVRATEQLCVSDVCVTKDQLRRLLEINMLSPAIPLLTPLVSVDVAPALMTSDSATLTPTPTPSDSPIPTGGASIGL